MPEKHSVVQSELNSALAREQATSQILRAIARSPSDYEPVFDEILDHATRLCDAPLAALFMKREDGFHLVAHKGARPEFVQFALAHPVPLNPALTLGGRAAHERVPLQTVDRAQAPDDQEGPPNEDEAIELEGIRTFLAVPMVKNDESIGIIVIYRREVRPFDEDQVAIVSTFADQAVLAVDMYQAVETRADELSEARERQSATAEILHTISRSPSHCEPVFDAILDNATRLCDAPLAVLLMKREDGLHLVAHEGARQEFVEYLTRRPLSLDPTSTLFARAAYEGVPLQLADYAEDETDLEDQPDAVDVANIEGMRSLLAVPLVKDEESVGVLAVYRRGVRPFDDSLVALLSTFADQAVIAIDNVRMYQAFEARTDELSEAHERSAAMREILSVINSSPDDYQPVFEVILENACRLCEAPLGRVLIPHGDLLRSVAQRGSRPEYVRFLEEHPFPIDAPSTPARAFTSREPVHQADMTKAPTYLDKRPNAVAAVEIEGVRTVLAVPMLKGDQSVGVIVVYRREVRPFDDSHIELLTTFADQAVIAIENVRLFQALRVRTEEVGEALEYQTATSEILRVISSSPTDYQPVFDAVLENACRLCEAPLGVLFLVRDEALQGLATRGGRPEFVQFIKDNPLPLDPANSLTARAVLECIPLQSDDLANEQLYHDRQPHRVISVEKEGMRSFVAIPMHKDREPVGAIALYRREVRQFEDKHVALASTFADQAVIAIENVRLFQTLEARTDDLTEALEHQTATSEVLRVISSSPTDYQPVFEAILENAARLSEAPLAMLFLKRGDDVVAVALRGGRPEFVEFMLNNPMPLRGDLTLTARVVAEGVPLEHEDAAADSLYKDGNPHRVISVDVEGIRTLLAVPMLKDGKAIGAIAVYRREVRSFGKKITDLISTFADQAVIAIENVRLFQALQARTDELGEALERQTATSEILRTISRSPTDYQPVFDAILDNATRLCDASLALLYLRRGEQLEAVATRGGQPEFVDFVTNNPLPLRAELNLSARSLAEGVSVQCEDMAEDSLYQDRVPHRVAAVELEGIRTMLVVPMLKDGDGLGTIAIYRHEVRPFDAKVTELLSTFANQAVIAIENVRLFQTLETRTDELAESLERQTATSEILRTISRSPTDYQPVFEAILDNATRLCEAPLAVLLMRREDGFHLVAYKGARQEWVEYFKAHPLPLDPARSLSGRAAHERVPLQLADYAADEKYRTGQPHAVAAVDIEGIRSLLSVPLVKNDESIGVLAVYRREIRRFDDGLVALVSTFADQAVIAIDNVRMFRALDARSEELLRSVGELRALGEVGQAVSSTLDLETVLTTIINQAVSLSGTDGGAISEFDELTGTLPLRAAPGFEDVLATDEPPRLGEGAMGQAAEAREPVQIPDVDAPGAYTERLRPMLQRSGLKALLAVPLLREDSVLGALLVARKTPGAFPDETVALLGTFAAQSAIAIYNARLFREIEEKRRELEAANRHKSEFLANMSHELRTPLNAVIGFSEVLGEQMFGELNEKQREYVDDIHSSGRHLLSLINDILDLSKIEAGRMELDLSRFEIRPALDNALTLVSERASRRNLTLDTNIEDELGEMTGDERKLKQILLNLLSNAIKFTPEGGTVTLAAHLKNGSVHMAVRDTGVGISEEDQKVIFDEFRQVGTDYARKVEGTGLGLTLTRRFVELHGGEIDLDSTLGEGSEFRIVLPLQPPVSLGETTD